jgi:hypothetical protein
VLYHCATPADLNDSFGVQIKKNMLRRGWKDLNLRSHNQ